MGNNFRARAGLVADVFAIGTCVVVCALVVAHRLEQKRRPDSSLSKSTEVVPAGTVLTGSDELRDLADQTVLVGLSPTCRYCTESMPAFRRLDEYAGQQGTGVRLLALGAQSAEVLNDYLAENRLRNLTPVSVAASSHLVPIIRATPTVVVLDRNGAVVASWPGLMTLARIENVIDLLRGRTPATKAVAK